MDATQMSNTKWDIKDRDNVWRQNKEVSITFATILLPLPNILVNWKTNP